MISVVIPAFNEEKYLPACLESLKAQDFPKDGYEIIVVDNASQDKTADVARSFGVKVIFEPKRGYAPSRQAGFMAAQGEIIASTDADTVLPPIWLELINQNFQNDPNLIGVTGLGTFQDSGKIWERLSKYGYWIFLKTNFSLGRPLLSGFNFAVRKQAFIKIGGFSLRPEIGEDTELSSRLKRIGRLRFDSRIVAYPSGRRFKRSWAEALKHYLFSPRVKSK